MIAEHVGRETQVEALGQTWTIGRWDLRVWDEFLVWARTQLPDPLEIAERACLRLLAQERATKAELDACTDDARRKELLGKIKDLNALQSHTAKMAMDRASSHLAVNSPEVQSLIQTVRGTGQLLYLLMKPHHADLTPDKAFEVGMALNSEQLTQALARAAGKVPGSLAKNQSAPEASS